MSEYEKVMKVLFDRGLPSETCGRVASIFEKKEELERQLEEAREDVKTYKYDLDTLSSIVIECVYDMSKDEAMSILKEVADHYKKLKEQG